MVRTVGKKQPREVVACSSLEVFKEEVGEALDRDDLGVAFLHSCKLNQRTLEISSNPFPEGIRHPSPVQRRHRCYYLLISSFSNCVFNAYVLKNLGQGPQVTFENGT